MLPIGTALATLFGAIPGLISEKSRGRWIYAVVGTAFVGLLQWYSTSELEDRLKITGNELHKAQLLREDVKNFTIPSDGKLFVNLASVLDREWQTSVLARQPSQRDYGHIDEITSFMLSVDPNNGHALYYNGQEKRARKMLGSSQEDFFKYLEVEHGLPDSERGGSTLRKECYDRAKGFCKQRTAWIQHLLANDFIEEAKITKGCASFQTAREYAKQALANYNGEFHGDGQGIPTMDVLRMSDDGLKSCAHGT